MNCLQAQQLLDDLSRDRLPAAMATRLRQHLADCTDCRVVHQRTARLQRLLALSRYEQPAPGYYSGILPEFHRRQAALAMRAPWWMRLTAPLASGAHAGWTYALAGAAVIALAWGAYWLQTSAPGDTAITAAAVSVPNSPAVAPAVTFAANPDTDSWQPVVVALPPQLEVPAPVQPPALAAATTPAPGQTPRYVLDRLPIMPASYDTARADF